MLKESETYGVVDPDQAVDAENESLVSDAIERFKTDPDIQAIYSEYSEAIDGIIQKAKHFFSEDIEKLEEFLADFSSKIIEAEEEGVEIIDLIDEFISRLI
jgi:uncharacterized phage-associated protein